MYICRHCKNELSLDDYERKTEYQYHSELEDEASFYPEKHEVLFCPYCGTEMDDEDEAKECPSCGSYFSSEGKDYCEECVSMVKEKIAEMAKDLKLDQETLEGLLYEAIV